MEAFRPKSEQLKITGAQLKDASVPEINRRYSRLVTDLTAANPTLSGRSLYESIAANTTYFIRSTVQNKVTTAMDDPSPEVAAEGRNAAVMLYMKSILQASRHYLTDNPDENEELTQAAITKAIEALKKTDREAPLATQVHNATEEGIREYISSKYGLVPSWLAHDNHLFRDEVEEAFNYGTVRRTMDAAELNGIAQTVLDNAKRNPPEEELRTYIVRRSQDTPEPATDENEVPESSDPVLDAVLKHERQQTVRVSVTELDQDQREAIIDRYGLEGEPERSYREIGAKKGLNHEAVRQDEAKGLKVLRQPTKSNKLREVLTDPTNCSLEQQTARYFENVRQGEEEKRTEAIRKNKAFKQAQAKKAPTQHPLDAYFKQVAQDFTKEKDSSTPSNDQEPVTKTHNKQVIYSWLSSFGTFEDIYGEED